MKKNILLFLNRSIKMFHEGKLNQYSEIENDATLGFKPCSSGIDFRRQNLMPSTSIPALK